MLAFLGAFSLILAAPSLAYPRNLALELDGDGDYVELPGSLFADLQESTIEGWVRWDNLGYFQQFFGFGSGEVQQVIGLNSYDHTASLSFFIYDAQHQLHLVRAPDFLQLGCWYHLAAVSGPGGMKLYANGVLIGGNDYEGSFAAVGNSERNYLGRAHWAENHDFQGAMDEVRVWRVARTAEEIRAHMHQRLKGDERDLAALWNFDAGDARDASPGGRHGRLMGNPRLAETALPEPEELYRPAVVAGMTTDLNGQPLAGVLIRLERNGQEIAREETDPFGRFVLTAEEGSGDLGAVKEELGTWRLDLALVAGQRRILRRGRDAVVRDH